MALTELNIERFFSKQRGARYKYEAEITYPPDTNL